MSTGLDLFPVFLRAFNVAPAQSPIDLVQLVIQMRVFYHAIRVFSDLLIASLKQGLKSLDLIEVANFRGPFLWFSGWKAEIQQDSRNKAV